MKISQIKEFIGNMVDKEIHTPLLLVGQTGIGKSQLTQQVSKERDIGFIDLRLATQEVSELIGIPRTQEVEGELRTVWAKPSWYPKEGTKGILALEEVNRAPEDVRQAIFQLLTEWKLHTHELPKGWVIISMINPDNGNYHVNKLDTAFLRRFIQIGVTPPDETDWTIWGKKNGVNDSILQFALQFPMHLGKSEDISIEVSPTRAGYVMLSEIMTKGAIPKDCLHEVASGIIGVNSATTFLTSLKNNLEKPITAEEILKDYSKVQVKYKAQIQEKRTELIYMTMIGIISIIDEKISKKDIVNLCSYLSDSPKEVLTSIILKAPQGIIMKLVSNEGNEELVGEIIKLKKELENV